MNTKQSKIVEMFRKDIMNQDGLGKYQSEYEYKKFQITEDTDMGLVFLITEVGRKKDEGTIASVFARTRRHIMIGKKGGIQSINDKKCRGYMEVLINGAEY